MTTASAKAPALSKAADSLRNFGDWFAIPFMTVAPLWVLTVHEQYEFSPGTAFFIYFAVCLPEIVGGMLLYKLWARPAFCRSWRGIMTAIAALVLMAYWPLWFLTVGCSFLPPGVAFLLYFAVGLPTVMGTIWFSATRASERK